MAYCVKKGQFTSQPCPRRWFDGKIFGNYHQRSQNWKFSLEIFALRNGGIQETAGPNSRYGQAGRVLGKTLVWSMDIMYFDVFFQVRIDHRTRSLSFGTDLGVAQKEDVAEGPCLQSMPSEQIRNQLIHFSQALHQAVDLIQPKQIKVRHTPDFFLVLGFYLAAIWPNLLKAKQKPIPCLLCIDRS